MERDGRRSRCNPSEPDGGAAGLARVPKTARVARGVAVAAHEDTARAGERLCSRKLLIEQPAEVERIAIDEPVLPEDVYHDPVVLTRLGGEFETVLTVPARDV